MCKKKKHLCITRGGKHEKVKARQYCHTCLKRQYRERNPMQAAYSNLKHNAKRRGKEFTLTIEEFILFCTETEYMKNKGRNVHSYTIDRIDDIKGYTRDNIQVLTNHDNNVKRHKKLEYDFRSGYATVVTRQENNFGDNPF